MAINKYLPNISGFYLGKVLKHLKHGKVKLWIPGVYEDKYKENYRVNDLWKELPDAVQLSPIFGNVNNGNGMFSYPDIDSKVVCIFLNNDLNYPAYIGSLLNGEENGAWDQWDQIFPEKEDGESHFHKINIGLTSIFFNENGAIQIEAWNKTEPGLSQVTLTKDGNMSLKCSGLLSIDAQEIKINALKQIRIESPEFVNINSSKNTTSCKSIELDAHDGQVTIRTLFEPFGTTIA